MKEITNRAAVEKDGSLKEGDVILRINSNSTDGMTLKEAKKLVDSTKERLSLVVRRDPPQHQHTPQHSTIPPDLTVKGKGPWAHNDVKSKKVVIPPKESLYVET